MSTLAIFNSSRKISSKSPKKEFPGIAQTRGFCGKSTEILNFPECHGASQFRTLGSPSSAFWWEVKLVCWAALNQSSKPNSITQIILNRWRTSNAHVLVSFPHLSVCHRKQKQPPPKTRKRTTNYHGTETYEKRTSQTTRILFESVAKDCLHVRVGVALG